LCDKFKKVTNRLSRIVCNSPRWNLLGQVGGAPGVDILGSVTLGAFNMPTESGVVSHVFSGGNRWNAHGSHTTIRHRDRNRALR
jgi:hypothetical protein